MSAIPQELKYTKTHEWVRIDGETAVIGITDFAQSELSDIVFVDITTVGKSINKESPLGTIEAVKAVSDIYAPLSGEVIAANDKLKDNPGLVNSDPYGEGWIAKIKFTQGSELQDLLDPAAYAELVARSSHH